MEVIKRVFFTSLLTALVFSMVFSQPMPNPNPCPQAAAHRPRTWNYTTAGCWGSQSSTWASCSSGCGQSPIDLTSPVLRNNIADSPMNIRYKNVTNLWIFNTGNMFVAPVRTSDGLTIAYNGANYFLNRIDFHSPSEHLVNGKQFDLEVQFVHMNGLQTLIFSVFFNRNSNASANQFLEQLIYDLPQFSDCTCGNGRLENINSSYPVATVGINEACDEDGRNANSTGSCCRPGCRLPRCGDGVIDTCLNETCDNGTSNSNTSDACRTNCCLPTCGDGILDVLAGEQCDDGNRNNLDGCSSICLFECGDGELNLRNGTEQCDNGTNNSNTVPGACRLNCLNAYCGDNVTDTGRNETCDDGTGMMGNAPSECRANCTLPYCGDGITDLDEDCDGQYPLCDNATCSFTCGDGILQGYEYCDNTAANGTNSNTPSSFSGCRTICVQSYCGDGIIDTLNGEQCDSAYYSYFHDNRLIYGVNIGNIYCSANCTQLCGNGLPDPGEQCDQGCYNADRPNVCRTNCQRPRCGDGIVDAGECCDTGVLNSNSSNACRLNCQLPKCGDGILDAGESCDDGNRNPLDGCDPSCRLECGNGNLEVNPGVYVEQCDLGSANGNYSDSCRTNCQLPFCGDGIVDSREQCDNGANNSNTAPNACRTNCRLSYCGDGIIDTLSGEKCDNGTFNSDTTVNGCSLFCIPNYCRQRMVRLPQVDLSRALPVNQTVYSYGGSLTRPPCTAGVQWLIFAQVQTMTARQLVSFTSQYGMPANNRPVQNTCSRTIGRPSFAPTPICGNGIQESGEACDLGYLRNSDTESNRCRTDCVLPYCGDGITDAGEECDSGTMITNYFTNRQRCTANCTMTVMLKNPYVTPVGNWSYASSCKWALLPGNLLCSGERMNASQSPIDINLNAINAQGVALPGGGLQWNYVAAPFNVINTGRLISATLTGAGGFTDQNGKSYLLQRIDFHSPSEHTMNGVHADMEAQLVHTTSDQTTTAIVSILYNRANAKSGMLDQLSFFIPRDSDCRLNNGIIDPNEQCDNGAMDSNYRPNQCRRDGTLPRCGDGVVDRGEECDNGMDNAAMANMCKPVTCRMPYCGDGYVDLGEQCDFAASGSTGCTKQCTLLCGNGILDAGEQCDNATANSNVLANACRTNCTLPRCGDGTIDANETCDNGVNNGVGAGSTCRADCTLPYCGDGTVDIAFGETCDLGGSNGQAGGTCSSTCGSTCGNGILAGYPYKQCDNGTLNSNSDGACRANCTLPYCGDGIVDRSLGEMCDNGASNASFCINCQLVCGNGIYEPQYGEQCDNGTLDSDILPNACRTNCRLPYCGDGVRDAGEQCDFGSANSNTAGANSPCRLNCVLPRCGDGILDAAEQCDDGNMVNGDGCSATCTKECGNGRRDAGEQCDDGPLNSDTAPDACSTTCQLSYCGDGVTDSTEQCDAGGMAGTPNACRSNCTLPYCGDGVLDSAYGEECDNGAQNNDFSGTCSTTCTLNACRTVSSGSRRLNLTNTFAAQTGCVITYNGSLTMPPCTEGVQWFVLETIHNISVAQLQLIQQLLGSGNSRGVQALNGRNVTCTQNAPAVCGNCIREAGEQCDQGDNNANIADKCRTNCAKPYCGDGIVDSGEQCDAGAMNSVTGLCSPACTFVTGCPAVCTGSSCSACSSSTSSSNSSSCGCSGSSCGSSCPAANINNSGTIINVNFANLLRGAGCSSSSTSGCGN